ncbi:DUF998 domain-containing protein [Candidatus Bathyarchaeota archaeon]|nr:MAG: DUF998 domain-containing protein [Candidatus Bathyarchaeota archaeon]
MMSGEASAFLGVSAVIVAFTFLGLSLLLSPSFSWWINALSDLGHSVRSEVAPIFNFGLLLTGFLISLYSVKALIRHARYTGVSLTLSGFLLQLVATFDEVYGYLHYLVSVLFFLSLGLSSILYAVERRSVTAAAAFIIGLLSWIFYWTGILDVGVAVPEALSSIAVALWIIRSTLESFSKS